MPLVVGDLVFQNVGSIVSVAALSVDDSAAVAYTITADRQGVTFQNVGTKDVWYGDDTVAPASNKGVKLFRNQSLTYKNVKSTFKIYFKCATGDSTTIGVNEHN